MLQCTCSFQTHCLCTTLNRLPPSPLSHSCGRSRSAGGDGGFLAALEARYASGSSGGGKRKKGATAAAGAANLTDEEFEAASARLQAKRKQPPQQPRKKNGNKAGKA